MSLKWNGTKNPLAFWYITFPLIKQNIEVLYELAALNILLSEFIVQYLWNTIYKKRVDNS